MQRVSRCAIDAVGVMMLQVLLCGLRTIARGSDHIWVELHA